MRLLLICSLFITIANAASTFGMEMSLINHLVSLNMSLDDTTVVIANRSELEAKLESIKSAGADALQVIADFDYTLTKFRIGEERASSTHGVVDKSPILGEDFQSKSQGFFNKYYPLEISDLPKEEKTKYMIEWWTSSHDLMIKHKLNKEHLEEMVKTPRIQFRDGVNTFFDLASQQNIPIHIFSAGLYDVIHAFLKDRKASHYSNVHVVSNMMTFDDEGYVNGFQGTLIHTMNKNAEAIRNSGEWDVVKDRKNVLLFGDNTGDVHMADGLNIDNIVRIGFLNDRIEERLDLYKSLYDVVVLGDPEFTWPLELFQQILSS